MSLGKDSPLDQSFDKNQSAGQSEQAAAQGRFHDELNSAMGKTAGDKTRAVQLAANDVQIGPNGMPVNGDPIANMVGNRVRQHMHDYSSGSYPAGTPGMDAATGHRPVANAADMEAGLFGPKSAQNTAQYNAVLQDFHTVDANFRKELAAHGIAGPQAEQMRQFLYFSNNQNQRNQMLKAFNLTVPQGYDAFEQKYGNKASLALHWAMEQH